MYLAISKIWYWFNAITVMSLNDTGVDGVGRLILVRLLERDIVIITSVIAFFFLDKFLSSKKSKVSEELLFFGIEYVVFIGLVWIYTLILDFFSERQISFSLGSFIYFTVGYLVVAVIMHLKHYFKAKETPATKSKADKLTMLQALLDEGILSQEEFEQKKLLCK